MVAVLVSGSGAVVLLAHDAGRPWPVAIMLLTSAIGAIGAVWGLAGSARDHELLYRRFHATAARIRPDLADQDSLAAWRLELLEIYQDEPDVYHALNAECYNAATRALGFGKDKRIPLRSRHRLLKNWIRFSPEAFDLPS